MSNQTYSFIESTLLDLADDFNIPISIIPSLIALLEQYPDKSIRGSQKGLVDGLERIIDDLKNSGALS